MMVDSVPAERGIAYNYPMERPKTSQGRPKTGHGRRRSDAEEPVIRPTEVPPAEDLPPRPTTSRSNRPRTSHGRRPPDQQQLMQQHQQRYIQQEQQQYEQQQQPQQQQHYQQQHYQQQQQHPYTQDDYPFERPKTSHGRRRSSLQLHDSSLSPRQYMTPDRETQPSPYRPGSAMRPGTSSLSHYSVLPPIGAKADPTPPPPPSPPRLGERSVTMLNLNADLQIMKLEDDGEEEEGEEEGGEMQKDGGVFRATGEAVAVGEVGGMSGMHQGEMGTTWQNQKQHQGETNILIHNPPPTTPDKIQLQREGSFLSGGKISEESPPPFRPLTRENTLSEEPSAGDSNSGTILLAVKLPDGQRVSRRFRGDETLGMVLHFAEVTSRLDFAGYDLVCDAPRTVFRDLGVTVAESGLATRTVLHIRFPDP